MTSIYQYDQHLKPAVPSQRHYKKDHHNTESSTIITELWQPLKGNMICMNKNKSILRGALQVGKNLVFSLLPWRATIVSLKNRKDHMRSKHEINSQERHQSRKSNSADQQQKQLQEQAEKHLISINKPTKSSTLDFTIQEYLFKKMYPYSVGIIIKKLRSQKNFPMFLSNMIATKLKRLVVLSQTSTKGKLTSA